MADLPSLDETRGRFFAGIRYCNWTGVSREASEQRVDGNQPHGDLTESIENAGWEIFQDDRKGQKLVACGFALKPQATMNLHRISFLTSRPICPSLSSVVSLPIPLSYFPRAGRP